VTQVPFTDADRQRLAARGIPEAEALRQLELLRHRPPPVVLARPCRVHDGIRLLTPAEQDEARAQGQSLVAAGRVTKFIPASGAATRMFQSLISAADGAARPSSVPEVRGFFEQLDAFPFIEELRARSGISHPPASESEERTLLTTLLRTMGYADQPKGLIPFHRRVRPRTACEDQLEEGVGYTRGASGISRSHFTVVNAARNDFNHVVESVRGSIESRHRCSLRVTFSEQHPSTDTIAIDGAGQPFRTADGELLFRPAGHGALIGNLQDLQADIVVIKNIDNIRPVDAIEEVVRWKLILIGVLAQVEQDQAFADRPLRVCGVVRNEGEPGGAPFWVRDHEGGISRQIVESAQVDMDSDEQRRIFSSATHFNPVDVVCSMRNAIGEPHDLAQFIDPSAAFVSNKTFEGRALTALERPGLWNGAMAHWTTVFVEVPGSTFAPVKTVFDLLRPEHR
jgi:hypothetical protein